MTLMKCGCKIIDDNISFEKPIYDDSEYRKLLSIVSFNHRYCQYVDVCGKCENKAKLFNDIEKTKLNLAKEQFKVLTEETVEKPEAETEPEP